MKRIILLLAVLSAVFLTTLLGVVLAQERSQIKVKSSATVSGVVLVDILKDGKPYRLQCNEGIGSCKALKNGTYAMVELPPNFGIYDCKNVEVYNSTGSKESDAERLGEYCLLEK